MPLGQRSIIVSGGGASGLSNVAPVAGYPWPILGQSDGLGGVNRVPSEAFLPTFEYDRWFLWCNTGTTLQTVGYVGANPTQTDGVLGAYLFVIGSIRGEENRLSLTQVAGANNPNGWAQGQTSFSPSTMLSTTVGRGGFSIHARCGFGALTANARIFVGLTGDQSGAFMPITAGDPGATLFPTIAFAADQADVSPAIFTGAGGAAATKTPLTVARQKVGGVANIQNKLYDIWIGAAPGVRAATMHLVELSGVDYSRTVLFSGPVPAGNLPATNVPLRLVLGVNSGANAIDVQTMDFTTATARWKAS